MRKLLVFAIALAMLFALYPDDSEAETRVFAGANHEGNWGVLFGVETNVSKVVIMPFARYSLDSTLTDEIRFQKSTGVETAIWLYNKGEWKFGLTASPVTVDWIDNQEETIGVYWSQSGGFAVDWRGENLGFRFWGKVKTDFKTVTSYNDFASFGGVLTINKFW